MTLARASRLVVCCTLLGGLAACGDGGIPEIRSWMDGVRKDAKIIVPTLSEPKKYTPFVYAGNSAVDPYNPSKLAIAFAKLKTNSNNTLKPDADRRREPLESYPLDALKMVGTLEKPGISFALLLADKTVFQIKAGNYIGQNFGMVTKVTESAVEIKEIVQDAAGDWVERNAKLELQETKK